MSEEKPKIPMWEYVSTIEKFKDKKIVSFKELEANKIAWLFYAMEQTGINHITVKR